MPYVQIRVRPLLPSDGRAGAEQLFLTAFPVRGETGSFLVRTVAAVPEPRTALLLGFGLAAALARRRMRRAVTST